MINGRIIVLIVLLIKIDEFVWLLSFFIVHTMQTVLDYLFVIHLQLFQLTLHVLYLIVNALEA